VALFLVIAFIVVPIVELYVIIQVGGEIGVLPTLALLILDSILGAMLLRAQGRSVWARFNLALAERRVPHREVFDGAMIIFGGALLLTPGFITDIFGLLLLIPPTRAVIRRVLSALFVRRIAGGGAAVFWTLGGAQRTNGHPPSGRPPTQPSAYDYEGSAHELGEPPQLPGGPEGPQRPGGSTGPADG
jgi:UPF0716 protein FxsA